MKNILVVSSGLLHPNIKTRLYLSSLLKKLDGFQFHFSTSTNDIHLLENNEFSSLILFLHQSRISASSFKALDLFLMKGGGLLALHSSSTCFSGHPDFWDMIGGRYISRDSLRTMDIESRTQKQPIFQNINRFTVRDTPLVHELQFGVTVHFETIYQNKLVPIVWSKEYYLGKVIYCSLGHRAAVLKNPEVRELIMQGLCWVDSTRRNLP